MSLSELIRNWLLEPIQQELQQMATALEQIQASVAKMDDTVDSAILAFQAIAAEMQKSAGNEQAIRDLATDLDARASGLAAAVVTPPSVPTA